MDNDKCCANEWNPCVHLEEVRALHQMLSNHRSYQVLKGTPGQKLSFSCVALKSYPVKGLGR